MKRCLCKILILAFALSLSGCASSAAEETAVLVEFTAPTVAPVVTPVPKTPAPATPKPTEKPKETEKPEETEKPKETEKPEETEKPKETEKPEETKKPERGNTPYADSYTPVSVQTASGSIDAFKTKSLAGSEITEAYFADSIITLVNYWSTTWGICVDEMGRLAEIEKEYRGSGVKFLGVVTDVYGIGGDTAAEAQDCVKRKDVGYPQVIPHTSLTRGLSYIPTTCVVNSSGKVLARYAGVLSHDEWINVIETLVNG